MKPLTTEIDRDRRIIMINALFSAIVASCAIHRCRHAQLLQNACLLTRRRTRQDSAREMFPVTPVNFAHSFWPLSYPRFVYKMPAPQTTLLIEGSFGELVEELADYIHVLRKSADGEESTPSLKEELAPHLEAYTKAEEAQNAEDLDSARDEVLETLVEASSILSSAPEKGEYDPRPRPHLRERRGLTRPDFISSHNLLLHLVTQSSDAGEYFRDICKSLTDASKSDVTASTTTAPPVSSNRLALSLTVLTTIFNIIPSTDRIHLPILGAILEVVSRAPNSYENLIPYLSHLDAWFESWNATPENARRLYLKISAIAKDSAEPEASYTYLTRAVRTIPTADAGSDEARRLAIEALSRALVSPTQFDFEDLTALDAVQALRTGSDATWFQLLELFSADTLEEYDEFKSENPAFLAAAKLDDAVLTRKMRLLTIASLAAGAGQLRSLPYSTIASALRIDAAEVEMWVIDVIRAGLVEGKLSQQRQEFLIHRSTYRVFGDNQWREVAGRLDMWKGSLVNVLSVIRQEKEGLIQAREAELKALEGRGVGTKGGNRGRRGGDDVLEVGMD